MPVVIWEGKKCLEVQNLKWILDRKSKVKCIFSWPEGTLEFYLGFGKSYIVKFADVSVREDFMKKHFPADRFEYWHMSPSSKDIPSDKCPEEDTNGQFKNMAQEEPDMPILPQD